MRNSLSILSDRPYYNVNLKLSNRATTFGYGIKYDFTKEYTFCLFQYA